MLFTADQIVTIIGGLLESGGLGAWCEGITIDSRKVVAGDLFIAIRGENFDGDRFVPEVFDSEANICIGTSSRVLSLPDSKAYIRVPDGLEALQKLAVDYRSRMGSSCVAITGSNGKTTIKECLAHVAGKVFQTARNPGNLNGQVGLPLSILRWSTDHELSIMEVGISKPGEMVKLLPMVIPSIAVFTNVGPVHLEFFADIDEIMSEKGKLLHSLPSSGYAILNGDDRRVRDFGKGLRCHRVFYGFNPDNDIRVIDYEARKSGGSSFTIENSMNAKSANLSCSLGGRHNVSNLAAVYAASFCLGIQESIIKTQLESFSGVSMRLELKKLQNGLTLVNDSYNASPLSMKAALEYLADLSSFTRRIAILGEMLELGASSQSLHGELGAYLASLPSIDIMVTVGKGGKWIERGALEAGFSNNRVVHFPDREDCQRELHRYLQKGDVLLLKASRGIAFEQLIAVIAEIGNDTP